MNRIVAANFQKQNEMEWQEREIEKIKYDNHAGPFTCSVQIARVLIETDDDDDFVPNIAKVIVFEHK